MAITKEFYVELDLKLATGNRDFTLVEGDTGNIIHVTLTDDGAPVCLTDCRVLAVFTKPTGSSMQDSQIEGGGVTIGGSDGNEVTIELFAGSFGTGTNACELQIYSGEQMDVLVTSAAFNFYCRNGIIDDETILSTDEYPLLTSLIAQVQAIEDGVFTPADMDDALSGVSENPVMNRVVKRALDGKAAVAHTHETADVTDFPTTMPPSAHTHGKADVTDFAHAHGSITDAGEIGSAADLPVFTGEGGALGVKSAAAAKEALGVGKSLLWEGNWGSGSITVPGFSNYRLFVVYPEDSSTPVYASAHSTYFRGVGGAAVSASATPGQQFTVYFNATCNGEVLTYIVCNYSSSPTVTRGIRAIYGLL